MTPTDKKDKSRSLEYNYRLWDTENNCYIDPEETKILIDTRGNLFLQPPGVCEILSVDKEKYVYEWNSKFTDKNTEPIFVGDIVKFRINGEDVSGLVGWDSALRGVTLTTGKTVQPFTDVQKKASGKCELVGSSRALEMQKKEEAKRAQELQATQQQILEEIKAASQQNE